MTHYPLVLLELELTLDRSPTSELVRRARDLDELGEWELEPRNGLEVWMMSCERSGLLLIVSLAPLEPETGDACCRRWLLTASANVIGEPWRFARDRVPALLHAWRPWVAAMAGIGLVVPAMVFLRDSLSAWSLAAVSLVVGAGSTAGLSVLLRVVLDRHRSRQRALLLADPTVRKFVERLGARATP